MLVFISVVEIILKLAFFHHLSSFPTRRILTQRWFVTCPWLKNMLQNAEPPSLLLGTFALWETLIYLRLAFQSSNF